MRFYSGKSVVTSPAYTHMDSFSAGQCPWAVTGEGGQILRAAVAVRAAYTIYCNKRRMMLSSNPDAEDP